MKKILRLLGGSLFICLLILVALAPTVGAHTVGQSSTASLLPKSPVSASTLMAQAIHSGKVHIPRGTAGGTLNPQLSCTPAPCVLPNVQASAAGSNPANEDPIATDPTNNKNLLSGANDYSCGSLQGFYSSSNAGTSWTHTCMNLLSGASGDGDPGVGYDLNHNSYITGIDAFSSSNGEIAYEKSSNNGTSWSAPAVAVLPTFSGGLTDKDWLQIDDNAGSPHANALYISVTQFNSSSTQDQISVSHSTNGGASWTTVAVDPPQSLSTTVDQFSDLAIGKDGTVYATWLRCPPTGPTGDCGGTASKLVMSKSTNGGNTWSAPVTVAKVTLAPDSCGAFYGCLPNTSERVSNIPAIDIDNSTGANAGHLYVTFYTWTGAYMKVQVATSTNGGGTWSKKSVAPTSDTHDQFFPWLSVSKTGVVGVTWLDRRDDPNNINYESFGTISTNGGTSYITNFKLASVASNPFNDGFGGGFMGDYTGNRWAGNKLFASWMDSRGGSVMQDEVGGYLK